MRIKAEVIAIVIISFCFTVWLSFLWGYSTGKADSACYVVEGD